MRPALQPSRPTRLALVGLVAGKVTFKNRPWLVVHGPSQLSTFITSFNNVPISLFLTGPGVATLPIQMLVYMEYYFDPTISALSSIIMWPPPGMTSRRERGMCSAISLL